MISSNHVQSMPTYRPLTFRSHAPLIHWSLPRQTQKLEGRRSKAEASAHQSFQVKGIPISLETSDSSIEAYLWLACMTNESPHPTLNYTFPGLSFAKKDIDSGLWQVGHVPKEWLPRYTSVPVVRGFASLLGMISVTLPIQYPFSKSKPKGEQQSNGDLRVIDTYCNQFLLSPFPSQVLVFTPALNGHFRDMQRAISQQRTKLFQFRIYLRSSAFIALDDPSVVLDDHWIRKWQEELQISCSYRIFLTMIMPSSSPRLPERFLSETKWNLWRSCPKESYVWPWLSYWTIFELILMIDDTFWHIWHYGINSPFHRQT